MLSRKRKSLPPILRKAGIFSFTASPERAACFDSSYPWDPHRIRCRRAASFPRRTRCHGIGRPYSKVLWRETHSWLKTLLRTPVKSRLEFSWRKTIESTRRSFSACSRSWDTPPTLPRTAVTPSNRFDTPRTTWSSWTSRCRYGYFEFQKLSVQID